jgi:hypothetical protein
MIDKRDPLPVTRQCDLLDLSRSFFYYTPVTLSAKDLELMHKIDEIHLEYPFYGSRKIRNELWAKGYDVGRDRVRRLMRRLGIEALYVKPRLSLAHPGHVKYPYLLRGLEITQANHVWAAEGVLLSCSDHGLDEPNGSGLATLQHTGQFILRGCFGRGYLQVRLPRDLQYGPGQPVHRRSIYRHSPFERYFNQHGRQGPLDGQRLYREALEKRQVRGYLPEGLWHNGGGEERACHLLRVLQRKKMAPKL